MIIMKCNQFGSAAWQMFLHAAHVYVDIGCGFPKKKNPEESDAETVLF